MRQFWENLTKQRKEIWSWLRKQLEQHPNKARVIVIVFFVALAVWAITLEHLNYAIGKSALSLWLTTALINVAPELAGIVIGVVTIDYLNERRQDQQFKRQLKGQLTRDLLSNVTDSAVRAIDELRHHGWLEEVLGEVKQTLGKAKLSGANLNGANLSEASLWDANLRETSLRYANLRWADLQEADLGGAALFRANLSGADLSGADLSGADLEDANLSEAKLHDANLRGAKLYRINLLKANLNGSNLESASLGRANLSLTNLSEANLSKARLYGTNLSGAILFEANLSDATLFKVNLNEAYLRESNITIEQLKSANTFEGAILPEELQKQLEREESEQPANDHTPLEADDQRDDETEEEAPAADHNSH